MQKNCFVNTGVIWESLSPIQRMSSAVPENCAIVAFNKMLNFGDRILQTLLMHTKETNRPVPGQNLVLAVLVLYILQKESWCLPELKDDKCSLMILVLWKELIEGAFISQSLMWYLYKLFKKAQSTSLQWGFVERSCTMFFLILQLIFIFPHLNQLVLWRG